MWIDKRQKQIQDDIRKIERDKLKGIGRDRREFGFKKGIESNRGEQMDKFPLSLSV